MDFQADLIKRLYRFRLVLVTDHVGKPRSKIGYVGETFRYVAQFYKWKFVIVHGWCSHSEPVESNSAFET